jgi:hypothetical protein
MAIAFRELAGSPEETYDPKGFSATRQILVAWSDRDAMVRELLGDVFIFGGKDLATYPNRSDVVVDKIKAVPWETKVPDDAVFTDVEDDLNEYTGQLAHMTISYVWMPPLNLPDPQEWDTPIEKGTLVTYSRKIAGEYRALPGVSIRWARGDSVPVPKDSSQTIRVPITEHHLTWSRVTKPPIAAMQARIGKVNDAKWNGYHKETLLYEGSTLAREFVGFPSTDPLADLKGDWGPWKVGHVFRELVIATDILAGETPTAAPHAGFAGWNHTWSNADIGISPVWDRLVPIKDPASPGQYELTNFDALFQNG